MSTDFKLAFVSGVHGSGKTTFCKKLADATGAKHYSASELIRRRAKTRTDKVVTSASKNQEALRLELDIEKNLTKKLIIDGHFCLKGKDSKIINVETPVFEAINADIFICIHEDPKTIAARLQERDQIIHDPTFISKFQDQEIKQCKIISNILETPFILVQSSSSFDFSKFTTE